LRSPPNQNIDLGRLAVLACADPWRGNWSGRASARRKFDRTILGAFDTFSALRATYEFRRSGIFAALALEA
jgi:hypothetical protein